MKKENNIDKIFEDYRGATPCPERSEEELRQESGDILNMLEKENKESSDDNSLIKKTKLNYFVIITSMAAVFALLIVIPGYFITDSIGPDDTKPAYMQYKTISLQDNSKALSEDNSETVLNDNQKEEIVKQIKALLNKEKIEFRFDNNLFIISLNTDEKKDISLTIDYSTREIRIRKPHLASDASNKALDLLINEIEFILQEILF